jgi:hypothetical protein
VGNEVLYSQTPEWLSRKETDKFVLKWGKIAIFSLTIIGVLSFVSWYNSKETPTLLVDMRSTLIYTGDTKLNLFMGVYPSRHGLTASPLCYLSYFQLTNDSSLPQKISSYALYVSDNHGWTWHALPPIYIDSIRVFALGIATPRSGSITLAKGSYRLGSSMPPESLKNAALVELESLSQQLKDAIRPHASVEGWAGFDCVNGLKMPNKRQYKLDLKDNFGVSHQVHLETPLRIEGETDITIGSIKLTGDKADLSGAYIKYYRDQ